MFGYFQRYDRRLLWINLVFLFLVASIPFPTSILSDFPAVSLSVMFYAGNILALAAVRTFMWWYASHKHRLINPHLKPEIVRTELILGLLMMAVFGVSIGIAATNPNLAMYFWLILAPITIFVRARTEPFME